jgi:predicted outer membrane repeat protein
MKRYIFQKSMLCAAFVLLPTLFGGFTTAKLYAQTSAPRSYYVNGVTGDDANNNGRSEETPFKTVTKAVEMAKMGVIKTITIIGRISSTDEIRISDAGSDEILITGKPDAGENEKASTNGKFSISDSKVRFTHITIEAQINVRGTVTLGAGVVVQTNNGDGAVYVGSGSLTITDDAVITGNKSGGGIYRDGNGSVLLIMTGNSKITNNAGRGIYYSSYNKSSITMSDNAEISGNANGGVYLDSDSTLTMSGNAKISGNTTTENGGGVYLGGDSTLTMSGNAEISGNTATKNGGGVYFQGEIKLDGGKITNNSAKNRGGGIYMGNSGTMSMSKGEISGNKAEYGAGVFVVEKQKFTMSGGTITANEAEFVGGGVYVSTGATYTASGGTVTGNTAGDGAGHDVFRQ